jgi:hypothetical protein
MGRDRDLLADEAHLHPAEALAARLEVDPQRGLTSKQAKHRQSLYGENRLPETVPRSLIRRVCDQLSDFTVLVLIAAALLSGFIGDLADTVAIAVIVLLNAAMGPEALAPGELALCLACAAVVFATVEAEKWLRRSARGSAQSAKPRQKSAERSARVP